MPTRMLFNVAMHKTGGLEEYGTIATDEGSTTEFRLYQEENASACAETGLVVARAKAFKA